MYLLVNYSSPWKMNHLVRWCTYHHDGFPLIFLSPKVCLWENGKQYRQASYFIKQNPWHPIHPHHIINKPSISSIIPIIETFIIGLNPHSYMLSARPGASGAGWRRSAGTTGTSGTSTWAIWQGAGLARGALFGWCPSVPSKIIVYWRWNPFS